MTTVLLATIEQGLLFSLVTLGLLISFRVLRFPDLTVDGSFVLGGAIAATVLLGGHSPLLAIFLALLGGAGAGLATAALNTGLRINRILSGLLVMLMLYSVNLLVMGRSNLSLLRVSDISGYLPSFVPAMVQPLLTFFLVVTIAKVSLDWFLLSESGTLLRALGDNERFVRSLAIDPRPYRLLGLGLANALVALAGALVVQNQGFADVNMGLGVIMVGFAGLVIGEALVRPRTVATQTLAAVLGAVAYYAIVNTALRLGLSPILLRLVTGLLVVLVLAASGSLVRGLFPTVDEGSVEADESHR